MNLMKMDMKERLMYLICATAKIKVLPLPETESRPDDLEFTDEWNWCTAKVALEWNGLTAEDYLGCCDYPNEEAFRCDDYFSEMVTTCATELANQVIHVLEAIGSEAVAPEHRVEPFEVFPNLESWLLARGWVKP